MDPFVEFCSSSWDALQARAVCVCVRGGVVLWLRLDCLCCCSQLHHPCSPGVHSRAGADRLRIQSFPDREVWSMLRETMDMFEAHPSQHPKMSVSDKPPNDGPFREHPSR